MEYFHPYCNKRKEDSNRKTELLRKPLKSRCCINPWNEDNDQVQFTAISESVNAAALTGALRVRDTGPGIQSFQESYEAVLRAATDT